MSLLGNLMKSVGEVADAVKKIDKEDLKKAVDAVRDAIPDEVKDAVKDAVSQAKKEEEPKAAAASEVTSLKAGTVSYETVSYEGIDRTDYSEYLAEDDIYVGIKIPEVLRKDFPQCEVKENVSPLTIGGTGKFMDYSFAVYKDGAPKLFIMICDKNTASHREYRWSKEEAEKNGIPMISFYTSMANRYWYIAERLAKYL